MIRRSNIVLFDKLIKLKRSPFSAATQTFEIFFVGVTQSQSNLHANELDCSKYLSILWNSEWPALPLVFI